MTDRNEQAVRFIQSAGWAAAKRVTVAGDASNRRYDRLTRPDGTTAILMDAPADKGEDVRPFIHVAQFLTGIDLSAPGILHADTTAGFLLLEDLGDDLFARVVTRDPTLERTLYQAATDVLLDLHKAPCPDLAVYDAATMTPLAQLAYDWYLFGSTDRKATSEKDAFGEAFAQCLAPFDAAATVLIQRDYHAENLLWLPERKGTARVGLLDFQDAMRGHPAYDLVSVLQDARRDVPKDIETEMLNRYIAASHSDADTFHAAYAVLGVQRNLRILGVFARLSLAYGKPHYVDLIPRVWSHVRSNLAHPALDPVRDMILRDLPAPEPAILERLKAKCATVPLAS